MYNVSAYKDNVLIDGFTKQTEPDLVFSLFKLVGWDYGKWSGEQISIYLSSSSLEQLFGKLIFYNGLRKVSERELLLVEASIEEAEKSGNNILLKIFQ